MTPERHSPAPARFFQGTDRALPVHTTLRKQRQRDRFICQLNAFALYPDKRFGPGCKALAAARLALEQRNLDLACRKLTLEIDTHAADRFKPHAGFHLHKSRQHGRRSEEHTSELQSHHDIVCRLLLEKKKNNIYAIYIEKKKTIKKKKI